MAGDPKDWKVFVQGLARGLGANITNLGVEYNAPLTNPINGCLAVAEALGVSGLYAWVNTPTGDNATVTAVWDAFGLWLAGSSKTST